LRVTESSFSCTLLSTQIAINAHVASLLQPAAVPAIVLPQTVINITCIEAPVIWMRIQSAQTTLRSGFSLL